MRKQIVAHRGDRLGSRLIAILNAIRISKVANLEFRFVWHLIRGREYEVNNPHELFTDDFLKNCIPLDQMQRAALLELPNEADLTLSEFADRLDDYDGALSADIYPCFFKDENEEQIREALADAFQDIGFLPNIKTSIDNLKNSTKSKRIYGLHARRGDIRWPFIRWMIGWSLPAAKYIPVSIYKEFIKNNKGVEFDELIIFSDDDELVSSLSEAYSFVHAPKDMYDRRNYTDIQLALLDMVLMSSCSTIVVPGDSIYSSTASVIGNSQQKEIISYFEKDEIIGCVSRDLSKKIDEIDNSNEIERIDFVLDVGYLNGMGHDTLDQGLLDRFLKKATQIDPDNIYLQFALADLHKRRGDYSEGVFLVNKAVFLLDFFGKRKDEMAFCYNKYVNYIVEAIYSGVPLDFPLRRSPTYHLARAEQYAKKAVEIAIEGKASVELNTIDHAIVYVQVLILLGRVDDAREFLLSSDILTMDEIEPAFLSNISAGLFSEERVRTVGVSRLRKATLESDATEFATLLLSVIRFKTVEQKNRRFLRKIFELKDTYRWIEEEFEYE